MQPQRINLRSIIIRSTTIALLALVAGCDLLEPPVASQTTPNQPAAPPISAEVGLAKHLKKIGAKFYGAYWCPHCTDQKQMFGEEAVKEINYIECDAGGKNPRPDLCKKAEIEGYPTWEIQGKQYTGVLALQKLADISGYEGDRNFKN